MKWCSTYIIIWLAIIFHKFQKSTATASHNIDDILQLKGDTGVITVTADNYPLLSRGVPGYFNILYITMRGTNSNGMSCQLCHDFEKTYQAVADVIRSQAPQSLNLFFTVDVNEVPQLVKDLKLQNVPHLVVYPPAESNKQSQFEWKTSPFYQYSLVPENAENTLQFGDFLAKILNISITVPQAFNVQEFVYYFVACMVVFIFIKKVILPKVTNKWKLFSIILSLGILLPSITGYKFVEMNAIPFIARDAKNRIMYFSGGSGWQFGIEIFSVSLMYIVMSALSVLLIYVPKISCVREKMRGLLSSFLACVLFYFFSYFISCYLIKNPGYPIVF
ncbi:ALI_HP2_G0039460.mRNA.1.CDS.1 [Saccharomyces cerevisiae]|nr:ALI_HP2_G0039460.mRNA.1.CDS.1 [Saccharomyces cerevisiae]CAI6610314.1 ALI_HP2_G0039460.mRNA.1.CDS.1 [Saccharomyces cerevisiae]CAI6700507.1 ALI_HP1_G0041310.mRNA.1.CDS.1 [Saccharomyces cerevisiae]CAI6844895.1 ALI_collapsed_G0042690.mRNA.1.CDS.1 [Saccharomyces cerevisiae]